MPASQTEASIVRVDLDNWAGIGFHMLNASTPTGMNKG
jgi:hypothetical protein